MYYKRLVSIMVAVLFIVTLSLMGTITIAQADEKNDDIVTGESVNEKATNKDDMGDEEEGKRTASLYQYDTMTSPWGETYQSWSYSPDIGYGEVGEGYSYTNQLTGATVSYQVTGFGLGSIPLPQYGGMNSQFGQASYGMFSSGAIPVVQPTPGAYTETSTAGNAYGEGYQYAATQPDPTAIMSLSLMQNPTTAGLGYAMAYSAGGFGGFSLPTSLGASSGIGSIGIIGGIGRIGGLGISGGLSGLGSFGGLGLSGGIGGISYPSAGYGLNTSYGASSGGYALAPAYTAGSYTAAPAYGGGYVSAPVSSASVPYYGYQNVPSNVNVQPVQQQLPVQYPYYY